MSNKQLRIVELLKRYAVESPITHKHAACLVRNGKILKITTNSAYSHAEEKLFWCKQAGQCLL
jgi:hypothetical protein